MSHSCADNLCPSSPSFSPPPSLFTYSFSFHLLPPFLSTPPSTFLFHLPFSFLFSSFPLLSSSSLASFFFSPSSTLPFSLLPLSFPSPCSFPPSSTLLSLFLPPPFLPPSFPLSHSSPPLALLLLSLSRSSSRGQSTPLQKMRSLGSSSSQFVGISLPVDILNMFEVC